MGRELSHGLCAREQDVIDLFEAGHNRAQIAATLDMKPDRVAKIISTFGAPMPGTDEPSIRRATAALAARIIAVHGHSLGAR